MTKSKTPVQPDDELKKLGYPPLTLCPNDDTVLKLRGLGKYMHSSNILSTYEHWECPDCGYTKWIYLPPNETPSTFDDGIPF